jgi:hypothetical protein
VSRRTTALLAAALLATHAVLAWLARAPGIFRGDDAVYFALARSLRSFRYDELFRADAPVHRMYPPGYPTLLALWSAIGGERFDWLVLLGIILSAASLLLVFLAARRLWGDGLALAVLLALSFNATLIESSGWLASEAPFMFFGLASLFALVVSNRAAAATLAGALVICGALTRSAGATFVVALVVFWISRRQYRRAALLAGTAAITVGIWLIFSASAPRQSVGDSYFADFSARSDSGVVRTFAQRIWDKRTYPARLYAQTPASFVPGTSWDDVVAAPVVAACFLVGVAALCGAWPVAVGCLTAYAVLLLVWPWTLGRFLYPVLPLAVLAMVLGARCLGARVGPVWATVAAVALALTFAVNGALATAAVIRERSRCDRGSAFPQRSCVPVRYASFFDGLQFVKNRLPPDALLVSARPATVYYFTGHRVISLGDALSQTPGNFMTFLRRRDARYVLLTAAMSFEEGLPAAGGTPLPAMVKASCRELRLERAFPPSTLLLRVPESEAANGEASSCQAVDAFITSYSLEFQR